MAEEKEQKSDKQRNLSEVVWQIIEKRIPEIASAVKDIHTDVDEVAEKKLQDGISTMRRDYEILFGYFASWMLPQSKEVRQTFVMNAIQEAFSSAILTLICNLFGEEKVSSQFLTVFETRLNEIVSRYEGITKMTATQSGLLHTPK